MVVYVKIAIRPVMKVMSGMVASVSVAVKPVMNNTIGIQIRANVIYAEKSVRISGMVVYVLSAAI